MRGPLVVLLAALTLVAPAAGSRQPAYAQVVAKEFSFSLSRKSIRAGEANIELVNFGADPHNLQIRRVRSGTVVGGLGDVLGGDRGELTITLKSGKYELYCSIANHEALGMKVLLTVKPRQPPPAESSG